MTIETPPAEAPPQIETLFDIRDYVANKTVLKFSGSVELDLNDTQDLEFFRSLKPGASIPANVELRLVGYGQKFGEDDDGNVSEVTGLKSVVVTTVYRTT